MSAAFRLAQPDDGEAICRLFRDTPQRGRVVLNFEREPCYFRGSRVICDKPETWVAGDAREPVKMLFGIGQRMAWINGQQRSVRYAHDLRLAPAARGGRMVLRLVRHVGTLLTEQDIVQTVILNENTESLNSVASGRPGMPDYYPCGDIETSLLFAAPRRRSAVTVRQAGHDDVAQMQALHDRLAARRQFYPCYDFARMLCGDDYYHGQHIADYLLAFQGTRLVGMLGLWDQKGFKQTRVLRYPAGLSWVRFFWNAWSYLFGGVRLPAAGGLVPYLVAHSLLAEDDDAAIMDALLSCAVRQRGRQYGAISVGFFRHDPLAQVVQRYRRQVMHSRHFLVGYFNDPRQQLDARPPYIEIARL